MPPMKNAPDSETHIVLSSGLGLGCRNDASDTTASAAEESSPPLPIISEHAVILGTVAATAVSPSFEEELDRGWIATLLRRGTRSRTARPASRRYPRRLDGEFIADARMDREMRRL